MAELKQDVIAGIGDRPTNANVIYPYFDAVVRQFIVGKDCILDGLYLGADGLSLSSGHCLCNGFVGELKDLIRFGINNDPAPTKIYGRFVINHSETDLDYFYIETDPAESAIRQDDILHKQGEYWLLLYENLKSKVDRNYPENAVYSDTAEHLVDNGTIAADVEIEGDIPTTPLMYDKRVASTGFVNEAVKELIGYETAEVKYGVYNRSGKYERDVGTIKLERKANYVIATATRTSTSTWDVSLEGEDRIDLAEEMPEQFRGTEIMYIPVEYIQLSNSSTYTTLRTIIKSGSGAENISGWKINR